MKDENLIMVDQVSPRIYVIYIGHTKLPATLVKSQWLKEEDKGKATVTAIKSKGGI